MSGKEKINSIPTSFRRVAKSFGIEEYELKKNGLKVLYKHDGTSPVVGVMVTYLVGSRHEATGHTGSTHILEHLMFKGSKKFPSKKGVSALDILGKRGALVNASTWLDRTNYYEVLPSEHFEFALELEADRMRNAIITQKHLKEELPAVISEYAMHENNPSESLSNGMWATAFMAHPYHHPTIGWLSDIENTSVKKLKNFYDTYYHPNNAVVTIVGDVEKRKALSLVQKYFGVYKKSEKEIPFPHTTEPEQTGKRFFEINRNGKNIVAVAFKVPEALSEDTPNIVALNELLASGKTSRLYRALVDTGMASSVWSEYMSFYDSSLMAFFVTLNNGVKHEDVENVITNVCKKVVSKGVLKNELSRALNSYLTEMGVGTDGHYALLSTLNEAIATGDWRFFFNLSKKLNKVTPKTVREVAKKYLNENGMTVGYYRTIK